MLEEQKTKTGRGLFPSQHGYAVGGTRTPAGGIGTPAGPRCSPHTTRTLSIPQAFHQNHKTPSTLPKRSKHYPNTLNIPPPASR